MRHKDSLRMRLSFLENIAKQSEGISLNILGHLNLAINYRNFPTRGNDLKSEAIIQEH